MVYGPTLELFQQQQKLRTYYNFINVDSVRYTVGGQKRMFVSAVRETPLYEPVPWLAYWGQRFMMFTHGFGLVPGAGRERHGRRRTRVRVVGHPLEGQVPGARRHRAARLLRRRLRDDGVLQRPRHEGARLPDRPGPRGDRPAASGEDRRAHRLALEADRLRVAQRQVLGARLLGPHHAGHARPLHPHAGRPARAHRAVPLLRLQPVRRRRGRTHRLDRQRA